MIEPGYRGDFNIKTTVSHVMVTASDDVDIVSGYINFIRRILFNVSSGIVRLSLYNDAARTVLAYRSSWKNDGDLELNPVMFVDETEDEKMYARIDATSGATVQLELKITRLS